MWSRLIKLILITALSNFNLMNLTKPVSQSKSWGKRLSRKCFDAEKPEWSNKWTFLKFFFYLKYFYFLVWTIRSPTHDIRGKNIVFVVLICSLISVNCGDDVLICSLVLVICGHVLIHYLVLVHFDHVVLNRSLFLVNCGHFVVICSLVLIFCGYIVLIRPLALVNFSTITSLVLVNCSDIVPLFSK